MNGDHAISPAWLLISMNPLTPSKKRSAGMSLQRQLCHDQIPGQILCGIKPFERVKLFLAWLLVCHTCTRVS